MDPSQCQVCMHGEERISHGKHVILNHNDPHLCQIWYVLLPVRLIQSLKVTSDYSNPLLVVHANEIFLE